MDQELLKFAISQGLFAALFIWLLIDTRKESKTREESLNKTIKENKKSATDREVRIFIKDIFNYYNSRCSIIALLKLISIIN